MSLPDFRRSRALLGFMTEQEGVNFIQGSCVVDGPDEAEKYRAKWSSARRAIEALKPRSIWPVQQRDPSQEHRSYIRQVYEQEAFKQAFPGTMPIIREVEVGKLVAFQRSIDIEYASELASKMKNDNKFFLEACLPLSFQQHIDVTFDQAIPGVVFSSYSPKLILSAIQLTGIGGPEVSVGEHPVRQPGALFLIGTQANYVQAVAFQSRLLLKNGYHRAYAALLCGREYIPAVLTESSDFGATGAARPGFFPKELLISDRPPLVRDFKDDLLASEVRVRSMRKVIRIRADDFSIPR